MIWQARWQESEMELVWNLESKVDQGPFWGRTDISLDPRLVLFYVMELVNNYHLD